MLGFGIWWVNERFTEGKGNTGGGPAGGGSYFVNAFESIMKMDPISSVGPGSGTWGNLEWLREPVVQILGWTGAVLYVSHLLTSSS
jgi:hypothetical protein